MKCLNCKKTIIELGARLNKSTQAIALGQSHLIEHEAGLSFVRCPYCEARNILEDTPTPPGGGRNKKFGRFDFD